MQVQVNGGTPRPGEEKFESARTTLIGELETLPDREAKITDPSGQEVFHTVGELIDSLQQGTELGNKHIRLWLQAKETIRRLKSEDPAK